MSKFTLWIEFMSERIMQVKKVVLTVLMIIAYRICQQLIYRYSLMTHHNTNPSNGHSVIDNDFAMALRTSPEDDDWQKVRDAKKRKQIQDRLAQRARRKRLREAKGNVHITYQPSIPQSQSADSDSSPANHDPDASHLGVIDSQSNRTLAPTDDAGSGDWQTNNLAGLPTLDSSVPDSQLADPDLLPNNLYTRISSPLDLRVTLPLTVFTALFLNGQILSIPCSTTMASKSIPPTVPIPISLRPTLSQLTTVHFQWIDRLPFPKLRDSLIRLQGVVDLDEFLNDIFVAPSFRIRRGAESWEARAWSMEEHWAKKWGWLFL